MHKLLRWVAALAALCLLTGCGNSPIGQAARDEPAGTQSVRFALNWFPLADHAAYYVAGDQGWYAANGLDVEVIQGSSTADGLRRVNTGQAEMGVGDVTAIINGIRNGAGVTMVGITLDEGISTIWTSKKSGITSVADLAGRTIGAPQGDSGRALFPALAAQIGFDDSKVEWVDVQPAAKFQALAAGRVDAIQDTYTSAPFVWEAVGGKENAVPLRFSEQGLDLYGHAIYANNEFLRDHPDQVKKFLDASYHGWQWTLENPREAMEIEKKSVPQVEIDQYVVNLDLLEDTMRTTRFEERGIGWIDEAKMQATIDILQKNFEAPNDIAKASDIFTTEHLPTYKLPAQ